MPTDLRVGSDVNALGTAAQLTLSSILEQRGRLATRMEAGQELSIDTVPLVDTLQAERLLSANIKLHFKSGCHFQEAPDYLSPLV